MFINDILIKKQEDERNKSPFAEDVRFFKVSHSVT